MTLAAAVLCAVEGTTGSGTGSGAGSGSARTALGWPERMAGAAEAAKWWAVIRGERSCASACRVGWDSQHSGGMFSRWIGA